MRPEHVETERPGEMGDHRASTGVTARGDLSDRLVGHGDHQEVDARGRLGERGHLDDRRSSATDARRARPAARHRPAGPGRSLGRRSARQSSQRPDQLDAALTSFPSRRAPGRAPGRPAAPARTAAPTCGGGAPAGRARRPVPPSIQRMSTSSVRGPHRSAAHPVGGRLESVAHRQELAGRQVGVELDDEVEVARPGPRPADRIGLVHRRHGDDPRQRARPPPRRCASGHRGSSRARGRRASRDPQRRRR